MWSDPGHAGSDGKASEYTVHLTQFVYVATKPKTCQGAHADFCLLPYALTMGTKEQWKKMAWSDDSCLFHIMWMVRCLF